MDDERVKNLFLFFILRNSVFCTYVRLCVCMSDVHEMDGKG